MALKTTNLKKYAVIIAVGLVLLAHQNCTYNMGPDANPEALAADELAVGVADSTGTEAIQILQNRCASCHNEEKPEGEIGYITDVNALEYYRLVIPGEPQISPLYEQVANGSMPPSGSLSQAEISVLYEWINTGLVEDTAGITPPTGNTAVLEAKWSSIYAKIVQPRCLSCHNATTQRGGVNLANHTVTLNTVQPGNPNASSFYTSTANGSMPQGGTPLSPAELAVVRDWILAGALNN